MEELDLQLVLGWNEENIEAVESLLANFTHVKEVTVNVRRMILLDQKDISKVFNWIDYLENYKEYMQDFEIGVSGLVMGTKLNNN